MNQVLLYTRNKSIKPLDLKDKKRKIRRPLLPRQGSSAG